VNAVVRRREAVSVDVFVLYFEGPDSEGRTFGKFLGVYSSQARAARAVERLQSLPVFRHYPKGFQVEAVPLDGDFHPSLFDPPPPGPPPD
jgi:hypothetical protein